MKIDRRAGFGDSLFYMKKNRKSWREIWYELHDHFERGKIKVKKKLPDQSRVKSSKAHSLFGGTLLRKELWSFQVEPLARGLALGLFVAFTPTMGLQMLLACFLILFFPGNLPIALAACWITNPLTAAPIYYMEYKVGKWLIDLFGVSASETIGDVSHIAGIYDVAGAMWAGSVIIGITSAILGYALTYGLFYLERKVRFEKLLHFRKLREVNTKKKRPRKKSK